MIYLDNAATTRPHPEVLAHLSKIQAECFGNPSSVHPIGVSASRLIEDSRKTLAKVFQVPLAGVIFCGSGTESDNLAIKGVIEANPSQSKQIITTKLEHAAVLNTCDWLANKNDISLEYVRINASSGQIDLDHLSQLVSDQTTLVSIQHVNSETGVIQDLAAISELIKSKNTSTVLHSDGVQGFTRVPVDLKKLGVDLYSISAHKFHGIKGAGALIMSRNVKLAPIIHGGGQENGFRSGTENVLAISAMAKAIEVAYRDMEDNSDAVRSFCKQFKDSLKKKLADIRLEEHENAVPHIISLSVPGVLGEVLLHHLAKNGICVSTGSACNATSKKLSGVLTELGFSKEKIMQTIRISLAASEIPENWNDFFEKFACTVKELQAML